MSLSLFTFSLQVISKTCQNIKKLPWLVQALRNSFDCCDSNCIKFRTLRKIPQFHLIFWYGNFVERHIFRIILGKSPETMWKLCLFTKFTYKKISEITVFYAVEHAIQRFQHMSVFFQDFEFKTVFFRHMDEIHSHS